MNKQTRKITVISSCILILLGIIATPKITSADELSVSGNGANSNNEINVSSTQQTTTQQTNTTQTNNTVTTSANTGNNSVVDTPGNVAVKTGDEAVTTTVTNSANTSIINTGCDCDQNTTATVTGNGANANNTVNVSSTNDTTFSVDQTATITNKISQKAVTGNNAVNNNNGSVGIKTGNITAETNIKNGLINVSNIVVTSGKNGTIEIKIAGNGANSINTINANETNTTLISLVNSASIINKLKEKYVTGNNSESYNTGNVSLETGNVIGSTNIANGPINVSTIAVSCMCKKGHNKPTSPAPSPTQPANNNAPASSSSSSTSSSSTGGSSSSGPGSVLGASANNLPVTGGSYWFFIALIGNILTMLLGGYLRLRSGRSPGIVSV